MADVVSWLPRGATLAEDEFLRRDRMLRRVLWFHVLAITLVTLLLGSSLPHAAIDVAGVVAAAGLGRFAPSASWKAAVTSLGLLIASASLIHVTHGLIEAHFHIFVVLILVALYQDWRPLLVAIGFTLAHHVIASLVDPNSAFSHAAGQRNPLLWSCLHAGFVAAEVLGILLFWRVTEQAQHAAAAAKADQLATVLRNATLASALQASEASARCDELTGLANRRGFNEQAERLLHQAGGPGRRESDPTLLCVAVLDLDHFKLVNDSYGHAIGDEALRCVARVAQALVRSDDCFARLGGEEFGLVLPNTSLDDAVSLIDRMRTMLAALPVLPDDARRITLSAGVVAHHPGSTIDSLLAAADAALYRAKRGGRNQVRVAPGVGVGAGRRSAPSAGE